MKRVNNGVLFLLVWGFLLISALAVNNLLGLILLVIGGVRDPSFGLIAGTGLLGWLTIGAFAVLCYLIGWFLEYKGWD